ncbi:MAG: hypothetical protein ABR568_15290 [Pyrinomonadaceae bacterium]
MPTSGEELSKLRSVRTSRAVGYMALDRSIIDRSIIDRGITLEDILNSQMLNGGPLPKPPSLTGIAGALQKPISPLFVESFLLMVLIPRILHNVKEWGG